MSTSEKYNSLSAETKEECKNALVACKSIGVCRPDEWKHIVDYYYEKENEKPLGWFNWFDY